MFDQPLIQMQDRSVLIFGPALLNANLARIVLSAIGNLGDQLSRKGKAFESEVRNLFKKRNMPVHTFKITRGGEEFEFDTQIADIPLITWAGQPRR